MVECEICGSAADRKAEIEGAVLNVCRSCSRYGTEIKNIGHKRAITPIRLPEEMRFVLTEDFSQAVKTARERRRLSREQLAAALKEKLSIIKRMEEGWNPPLQTAKKIERFLGISILEKIRESAGKAGEAVGGVTIGDIAFVKRKKVL